MNPPAAARRSDVVQRADRTRTRITLRTVNDSSGACVHWSYSEYEDCPNCAVLRTPRLLAGRRRGEPDDGARVLWPAPVPSQALPSMPPRTEPVTTRRPRRLR